MENKVDTHIKIDKVEAKKLIDAGTSIWVVPSKAGLNSMWIQPFEIAGNMEKDAGYFDKVINSYKYYNCNKKQGLGIQYYKKNDTPIKVE